MSVITFSTEPGSKGRSIAKNVAKKLGYQYVDREIIREAGKEYSVPEKKLEEVFTKNPGIIERFIEDQSLYLTFIENIIIKFASRDNIVIAGSGGQYVLRDVSHALKIRVIAPFPLRVKNIMEREGLDAKEAEERVGREDKSRMSRMHNLFKIDWNDPSLYDLLINTRNMTEESAAEIVVDMINKDEYKPSPESIKLLGDLTLTSSIKARVASHPMLMLSHIDIITRNGIVTVSGRVLSSHEKDLIIKNVKEVVGEGYIDNLSISHHTHGDFF